jgi:Putative Ig domain
MMALTAAAMGQAGAGQKNAPGTVSETGPDKAVADDTTEKEQNNGIVIEPKELPVTYPHGAYQVRLRARGDYVPVLHWSVRQGALPPGIVLDDSGVLHGEAQRAGEFQFVVTVRDGGNPQQAVEKRFVIKVVEALTVAWKVPAHVNANRIEGSVEITNATADDVDLTFDAKAVAEDGRATEIGYQHFPLKRGTIGMALPFGETLPHGAYVVYVDVNGEVAKRNAIYKQELRTPAALQVVVGP